jgi:hypothetical protein
MAAPVPLPDFREHKGDPVKRRKPQVIDLLGKPTMLVHCSGMLTGLLADSAEAGINYDGQIMLVCYTAGELGMMYLMSIEHARNTAASITRLCDKQEAAAKQAAADALQKAAGK